jgi:hypothetical protein
MMAKAAATLDRLSGGRVVLGLGAGANVEGVAGLGFPTGAPGERFRAFEEYLEVVRGLWESDGPFSYSGTRHRVVEASFGPAPERRIPIWVGPGGPRILRLTGRLAGGVLVSIPYVPPEHLAKMHRLIDEGAAAAGRSPSAIRRGYNLMGVLETGSGGRVRARPGLIAGGVEVWVAEIVRFATEYRMDTFTFWPVAGDELRQIEVFAKEVAPAARERLSR